jgi:hypothetical protein
VLSSGIRDFAAHVGSDLKVYNPGRLMRLPGFYNMKDPKNPKPCHIAEITLYAEV